MNGTVSAEVTGDFGNLNIVSRYDNAIEMAALQCNFD